MCGFGIRGVLNEYGASGEFAGQTVNYWCGAGYSLSGGFGKWRGSFINCCLVCKRAEVVIPGGNTTSSICNTGSSQYARGETVKKQGQGFPPRYKVDTTSNYELYMK